MYIEDMMTPITKGHKVIEIYALIAIEKDGSEGLVGVNGMPLIVTEKRLVDKILAPYGRDIHRTSKKTMKIIKLTGREELKVFDNLSPKSQDNPVENPNT